MNLFDILMNKQSQTIPKGFIYIPDFISDNFGNDIYNKLEEDKGWFAVSNNDKSRKVINYGYKYNYKSKNSGQECTKFPDYIIELQHKIENYLKLLDLNSSFNQCIINKYLPGQGIGYHTDSEAFDNIIVGVSLGSGIEMIFRNNDNTFIKYLKPNSIFIMHDECRYHWTHEIKRKKYDIVEHKRIERGTRISVTFRHVKNI